jgi:hypothetical protein
MERTLTPSPATSIVHTAPNEANVPGISWAAVLAGGFVAAALSLALLALGSGLGLSSVSPWSNDGVSAKAIGFAAIVWLVLMQAISGSIGGYMAGRLRTKWVGLHTDEVAFRDTAHGFLVWALGVVVTAGFLTATATALVGGGVGLGATAITATAEAAGPVAAQAAQQVVERSNSSAYLVDSLFRSENPPDDTNDASIRGESARILATGLRQSDVSPADRTHLARMVAARTGMSQAEAEKRVSEVIAQARNAAAQAEQTAKQATDEARKAAAKLSFVTFLSLLIGAFCASIAATWGGRHRDFSAV